LTLKQVYLLNLMFISLVTLR